MLKQLLSEPSVSINGFIGSGSPLHGAMINKKENLVEGLIGTVLMTELLLEQGVDPNYRNKKGGIITFDFVKYVN